MCDGKKGKTPTDLLVGEMEIRQHMGDGCGIQDFKHQTVVFPTGKCVLQKKRKKDERWIYFKQQPSVPLDATLKCALQAT